MGARSDTCRVQVYRHILQEAAALVAAARAGSPCTRPVYLLTWARRGGDTLNCAQHPGLCTFEGTQDQLTTAYTTLAYVTQPASVAPAGEVWRAHPDRAALFAADGSHPSEAGTYAAALALLETIWPGTSGLGNAHRPAEVTEAEAAQLQTLAHQTVASRTWSWPEAGPRPCSYCLP